MKSCGRDNPKAQFDKINMIIKRKKNILNVKVLKIKKTYFIARVKSFFKSTFFAFVISI